MTSLGRLFAPVFVGIYERPRAFPLTTDLLCWIAGFALYGRYAGNATFAVWITLLVVAVALQTLIGRAVGIYRYRWRISSFDEVLALAFVWGTATSGLVLAGIVIDATSSSAIPSIVLAATTGTAILLMFTQRAVWRRWWEMHRRPQVEGRKRTVVFGAGEGGDQVIRAMLSDPHSTYYPVALIDDNPILANRSIAGARVEGTRNDVKEVAARHNADVLLIAIVYANSKLIKEAAQMAADAGLEFRVLPSTSELVGKMTVADVRPPTVEDLLGRDPVEIDLESVAGCITNRSVLITGAGGSIGSELARQVTRLNPAKLYLLDRDESALHGLQLSIQDRALLDCDELILADIRDRDRVFAVMEAHKPEVVFHTAALKHLTLLENHPDEGIKTNTMGTRNLLEASLEYGVKRFVNISTDKAADPSSVLGATKLAAERLTAMAAKSSGDAYLSVRFGNVLGSRGSVLPTFLHQIEKGKRVTVTHEEVTRYFMTIPEAVRLVIQAAAIGDPGEVLILDMGEPVKIVDLAQQLIDLLRPGIPIEFTGLRPGEKLHEVLIAKDEVGAARVHPRITHTATGNVADPADALETMGPDVVASVRSELSESVLYKAIPH